jgi:hypothetical protein
MSDFDDILEQLKQRRDELRVQMHLASKEIKEDWDELEEKMEDFSKRAKLGDTGSGVGDALVQVGRELKKGYERIRDALKDD